MMIKGIPKPSMAMRPLYRISISIVPSDDCGYFGLFLILLSLWPVTDLILQDLLCGEIE